MKYFHQSLFFVVCICVFAFEILFYSKPASVLDVALFSWLAFCALAEKLGNMK